MASEITISNKTQSTATFIKKNWSNRHLIPVFIKRELSIKYSQTFLKKAWMLIQPLGMMVVFSLFFGYILGWKTGNIPFPIYVFSGLIVWNLFNSGVQSSMSTFFDYSNLIKNNLIPTFTITLSKIILSLIDCMINVVILVCLMILYGLTPSAFLLVGIIPLLLMILLAISISLIIQTISIRRRDLFQIMPYLFSMLIWLTPVFFTPEILPENLRFLLYINPITGIIELWRTCLFSGYIFDFNYIFSIASIIPFFLMAIFIYKQRETKVNDIL